MAIRTLAPPSPALLALESWAAVEYATFGPCLPLLAMLPQGDGHPVLVLPGFTGSDRSTAPLRRALMLKNFAAHGWRLGTNVGPHDRIVRGVERRLLELHERAGRRVSLVGWSLGGLYARELARDHPGAVRQVITLGSPFRFRDGDRGAASALYDVIGPPEDPFPGRRTPEEHREPLQVPATSIYTRTDGVVRWHACIDAKAESAENIQVLGTHSGLAVNIAAVIAVVDRLAQPEGGWHQFRPPACVAHLYPRAASWRPR